MLTFKDKVELLVGQIPSAKVLTYGTIAALCDSPRAARQVGQIARYGDPQLPWHRVVRYDGGMASGYPGGMGAQAEALREEGITVENFKISISEYLWSVEK